MQCPNTKCLLIVKEGKIYCEDHNKFLAIAGDWENQKEKLNLVHVLYVAFSNGKEGQVLIDEEQ